MKLLSGTTSVVSRDGLRYRYKASTPMFNAGLGGNPALSCYWCGRHHQTSDLRFERIAGKQQRVCRVPCRQDKPSTPAD